MDPPQDRSAGRTARARDEINQPLRPPLAPLHLRSPRERLRLAPHAPQRGRQGVSAPALAPARRRAAPSALLSPIRSQQPPHVRCAHRARHACAAPRAASASPGACAACSRVRLVPWQAATGTPLKK